MCIMRMYDTLLEKQYPAFFLLSHNIHHSTMKAGVSALANTPAC